MKRLFFSSLLILAIVVIGCNKSKKKNSNVHPDKVFTDSPGVYQAYWPSLDKRKTPEWWSESKFGIFIHWGVYSVPAYAPTYLADKKGLAYQYAEHYEYRLLDQDENFINHHNKHFGKNFQYKNFADHFKAQYFDPDSWANLFLKSGAKYVVLTSKHHDGFCLWPSKQSKGWNSVAKGPHQDIVGSLSNAVRKKGLRMGLYYSLLEWTNPLYSKKTIRKWVDSVNIPQLKDLVTTYKPEIIFADGEWDYTSDVYKSESFLSWLYNHSAVKESVVVNDRWGKETRSLHGGYYTTEYNFVTDSNEINQTSHPWEESRGIGKSYGYNQFETTADYLSSKDLIHLLINKVSNGGNLLLNIGPDANGLIPVIMQERLLDIGNWLKTNGEAIYGTTMWKKKKLNTVKNLFFTQKGNNIYIILTKFPDKPVIINGITKALNVKLLGLNQPLKFTQQAATITIAPPVLTPNNLPCSYAWVLKIKT